MVPKVLTVGNSSALPLPKKFIEALHFPEEGIVRVNQYPQKGRLVVDFLREEETVEEVVDKEVYQVAKQLLRRYLPAFKELAKK